MIRVRFETFSERDIPEVWLDASARAVPAAPYVHMDAGQGGVTFGDLTESDLTALSAFRPGDEVFVESDDPTDVLDDTDAETEAATKIWWRATLVRPEISR